MCIDISVQCLLPVFRQMPIAMFAHLSMGTIKQIQRKVLSKPQPSEQA